MNVLSGVLAVLAGAAVWASFAPLSLWLAALLGIGGLVALLEGKSVRASALLGFLFGLGYFAPLLWWAWTAAGTALAWVALSVSQAAFFALLSIVWQGLMRGPATGESAVGRAVCLPAVWIGIEQLRAIWPLGGFGWGVVAFGQVDSPLVRLAPLGSTQLVGGILVATAVLVEYALLNTARRPASVRLVSMSVAVLLVFLPWFAPLSATSEATIRVAFAQGEVARPDEEVEGSRALGVTRALREEVSHLEADTFDVLVLPESTSDRDFRTDSEAGAVVGEIVQQVGVPVLLGTQEYVGEYRTNDYVAVVNGEVTASYSKQHPVPFGEYAPWRRQISAVTSAIDQIAIDMVPGEGPAVLDVPVGGGEESRTVRFAVPICFEVADTAIVSEAVRAGAQILVVPTNNASFADTAESQQQFDMTRFRAVETGRAAVQVSTVGVSGAIEPNGVVLVHTGRWTSESHTVSLPLRSGVTPAVRLADQIRMLTLSVGGLLAALALAQLAIYRTGCSSQRKKHT